MNHSTYDGTCFGYAARLPTRSSNASPVARSQAQGVQPFPPPITAPLVMASTTNPLANGPRAYELPYWVDREPQQSAQLVQRSEHPLINHPPTRPLSFTQELQEEWKTPKPTQRCRTSRACISCRARRIRCSGIEMAAYGPCSHCVRSGKICLFDNDKLFTAHLFPVLPEPTPSMSMNGWQSRRLETSLTRGVGPAGPRTLPWMYEADKPASSPPPSSSWYRSTGIYDA